MLVFWNCPDCAAKGEVEISGETSGWGIVKAAVDDHTQKSPHCRNPAYTFSEENKKQGE